MKKSVKQLVIAIILVLTLTGCTKYLKGKDNKSVINPKTGQSLTENILCRPTDEETIKLYLENGIDLSKLPYCSCEEEYVDESKYKLVEEEKEQEVVEEESKDDKKDSKKETKKETKKEETKEESDKETEEETKEVEKTKCKEFKVTSGGYDGIWSSIFVKPLAWLILFLGKYCSSFGLGLIVITIIIRLAMYPLTKKTAMQSELMKKIQPELDRLEKKYEKKDQNDREVMMAKSQEMMAIYKKHNFNPMSGCLTSFIQLPIFIAFLEAINRVPAIFEEKFLGLHLGTSPSVGIGNGNWLYLIIIVLVGATTWYSFAKAGNSGGNEQQQKQTKMMMNGFSIMITVMSFFMTSALGIYWTVSNIFTLVQNYLVKRRMQND
jgi:YidC/Oxa1 family membrane protein insertase